MELFIIFEKENVIDGIYVLFMEVQHSTHGDFLGDFLDLIIVQFFIPMSHFESFHRLR